MSVTTHEKSLTLRSYVSVEPFNLDFFTYSVTMNASFQRVGTLALHAGLTSVNCPQGRVLRETGKKLYPGVNPGVSVVMVGVFDSVTLFNGYIDPNSPIFAVFSTDRPNYLPTGVDPGSGGLPELANAVYTQGRVDAHKDINSDSFITAGTSITAGTYMAAGSYLSTGTYVAAGSYVNAGTFVNAGTYITAVRPIRCSTITDISGLVLVGTTITDVTIDVTLGQVFKIRLPATTTTGQQVRLNAFTNGIAGAALPGGVFYTILVSGGGTNNLTLILGNNMREQSTGNLLVAPDTGKTYVITWLCDGTNLLETARTLFENPS
jgi:hypothetical protein